MHPRPACARAPEATPTLQTHELSHRRRSYHSSLRPPGHAAAVRGLRRSAFLMHWPRFPCCARDFRFGLSAKRSIPPIGPVNSARQSPPRACSVPKLDPAQRTLQMGCSRRRRPQGSVGKTTPTRRHVRISAALRPSVRFSDAAGSVLLMRRHALSHEQTTARLCSIRGLSPSRRRYAARPAAPPRPPNRFENFAQVTSKLF